MTFGLFPSSLLTQGDPRLHRAVEDSDNCGGGIPNYHHHAVALIGPEQSRDSPTSHQLGFTSARGLWPAASLLYLHNVFRRLWLWARYFRRGRQRHP